MYGIRMASLTQSGSWTSSSILAGYGLSAKVGPTQPTPADMKRFNSRSGGKHSGVGNWMQSYRPKPIMGSGRPKKMYNYELGDLPVIRQRLPGLATRKVSNFKGLKKSDGLKTLIGMGRDVDGNQTPVVVGKGVDLMEWLKELNEYDPNDTETQTTISRRSSLISDEQIRIPDRMVQNDNIGPNAARQPPPYVPQGEQEALNRLRMWIDDYDQLPAYSPATNEVEERLRAEAAERAAF